MIMAYIASGSLGVIVGWLIWTFVHRAKDLSVQAITSLACLAAGGVVIAAASWRTEASVDALFAYPIGALLAIMMLGAMKWSDDQKSRDKAD